MIGSCVTRDIWRVAGGLPSDLLVISRTSLASLLSPPVPGIDLDAVEPGKNFASTCWKDDVGKTALEKLVAWRPDLLILDFIDERFDMLRVGTSFITLSGEFRRSPLFGVLVPDEIIPIDSRRAADLWTQASQDFAAWLRFHLPGTRFIVHRARCAPEYADRCRVAEATIRRAFPERMFISPERSVSQVDYNDLLQRQADRMLSLLQGAAVIDVATRFVVASSAHLWGLAPYHYVDEYYDEARRQIEAAVADDLPPALSPYIE